MVTISTAGQGQVATPVFAPTDGAFDAPVDVSIACGTPGAEIRYTLDGTTPTVASALYSGPIRVHLTTTVKAIALQTDLKSSAVSSATYTIGSAGKGILYGRILTPEGDPIPNANVSLDYEITAVPLRSLRAAGPAGNYVTGADGRYYFYNLDPGSYKVKAERSDYFLKEEVVTVSPGGATQKDITPRWKLTRRANAEQFNGIWCNATPLVYAVGDLGTAKLYDGHLSGYLDVPTMSNLKDIWGTPAGELFIVGEGGTVLHYTGSSWDVMDSGVTREYHRRVGSEQPERLCRQWSHRPALRRHVLVLG